MKKFIINLIRFQAKNLAIAAIILIFETHLFDCFTMNECHIRRLQVVTITCSRKDRTIKAPFLSYIASQIQQNFSNQAIELNIYNKNITKLYDFNSNRSRIVYLDIRFNMIALADSGAFQGLSELRKLYMDYNRIESLHDLFACVSMPENYQMHFETLSLSNNRIKRLDQDEFSCMSYLRELDLSFNKLSLIDAFSFSHLKNLSQLKLS
jgi:Leucine-rich repeat (LRR) protein